VAALPPFNFQFFGFIWLIPWFLGLSHPSAKRIYSGVALGAIPVSHALAGSVIAEPKLGLMILGAVIILFTLSAWIAARQTGETSVLRLYGMVIFLSLGLAALRQLGLPISLSLLAPEHTYWYGMLGTIDIIGVDLFLGLFQLTAALSIWSLQHQVRALARWASRLAGLMLMPVFFFWLTPGTNEQAPAPAFQNQSDLPKIAVIQTAITPTQRRYLSADGVLEWTIAKQKQMQKIAWQLGADWIIWPESSTPGLIPPADSEQINRPGRQLRHGYAYQGPGVIDSQVTITRGLNPSIRMTKHHPLAFAEKSIRPNKKPSSPVLWNTKPIGVLICSEAIRSNAINRLGLAGADIVINPTNTAFLGVSWLGELHRKAVQIEAARAKTRVLIVTNAGPSTLVSASGYAQRLEKSYRAGVSLVRLNASRKTPTTAMLTIGFPLAFWLTLVSIPIILRDCRLPAPRQSSRNNPIGIPSFALGLLLVSIIWHQNDRFHAAIAPLEAQQNPSALAQPRYQAVTHSAAPHRGALAMIAREFGKPLTWRDIPSQQSDALQWLCEKLALKPIAGNSASITAPAIGLLTTPQGLHAVKWRQGNPAIRFNPANARFIKVLDDSAPIHWLKAAHPTDDCRSAFNAIEATSGTSNSRPGQ
jgi:apolipoprotein N-acyltransferase